MEAYYVDSYNYYDKKDEEKDKFYRKHISSEKEQEKTKQLQIKLEEFVIKTNGEEALNSFYSSKESNIHYIDKIGYVTLANYDKGEIIIYGYGNTSEEAFIPASMDYEFSVCENYEWIHRTELNKEYSKRFLDGNYTEKDYHGAFFYAELALKDFRKYYGENIPEEIIDYYERYLKDVGEGICKYDYKTNQILKIKEKSKIFSKRR